MAIGTDSLGTGAPGLDEIDQYRREITAYCYRMLGSSFEAEDGTQETMLRAWKSIDGFEGRSSLRSWLYRIATNVCLDMLRGRERRARPMEMGPAGTTATFTGEQLPENAWLTPIPDGRVVPPEGDPAELAATRESIRLAFVAALQHLPPRQRAALILCEVLKWQATEAAELLDTTVASINSALQRARATLGAQDFEDLASSATVDPDQQAMLARYVDAFERYDVDELVTLLRDDVVQTMPPYNFWLVGPDEIRTWFRGPGAECEGSRLVATAANGSPAFGQYRRNAQGEYFPWALQVLEISGDRVAGMHFFLDTDLFAVFGLPPTL